MVYIDLYIVSKACEAIYRCVFFQGIELIINLIISTHIGWDTNEENA